MNPYDCQAPMFSNFTGNSLDDLSYFDFVDHENEVVIKEEVPSPEVFLTPNEYHKKGSNRRRSRSVGDLQCLRNENELYQLRHAMNNMMVSESGESLADAPSTSNPALSSSESKENLIGRQQKKEHQRNGKYETMAEQINRFQNQTPERFHRVSSKASAVQVLQELNSNPHIKPKTPRLLTKTRSRPNNVISYVERQELEYQEALKNKMKSRKFSRDKLYKAPSLPNVARLPVTKFEPFKLSQPKKHTKVLKEKHPMFKARSIPDNIFEGPTGVKPKPPPKCTVPKTPNITMPKKALRNNTPHTGVPSVPKQGPTKVVPFSFEERDKQLMKRKEEFIQKFMEEEKKKMEIRPARPMPRFETPTKPIAKLPAVIPKTPNFASAGLREEAERKFKAKLEQEEMEAKAKAIFKARPAKVLEMKPFAPELPHQYVEVEEFVLSSEIRAKARQAFDEKMKQKEQERRLIEQEQEIQRRQREEEEIINIRRALVPRAQPIRHFKPIEVKRSEKEITNPRSPKLGPKKLSK